ncbi:MAG: hypothetical protein KatS3mg122_3303 [Caldimonas sp.]|nr:MAG: hypothetical protein KatS3mg122_3303 [Caldimonas sp.]
MLRCRNVPAERITLGKAGDARGLVATVFDLLAANYGSRAAAGEDGAPTRGAASLPPEGAGAA